MTESTDVGQDWIGQPPIQQPQVEETLTRFNYVIPNRLEHLLAQYCAQTGIRPGPLVRRLISDFLKGETGVNIEELDHPKGRRSQVDLPERLLNSLETRCQEIGAPTKAALIAALLGDFLPPRVDTDGIEKVTIEVPTSIYQRIYERYGPGPKDEILVEALCDLIQKNDSKAIPAEQEA